MKEKIARLAKGITEEELPTALITPQSFSETVFSGSECHFTIGIESADSRILKGACVCDEIRVEFSGSSFLGRTCHLNFTLNIAGLSEGRELKGNIGIISNAGEFLLPYHFTVGPALSDPSAQSEQTEESTARLATSQKDALASEAAMGTLFEETKPQDRSLDRYRAFLLSHIPEDDDLLLDLATLLVQRNEEGSLALAIYRKAIERGLEVTHLYESFMNAWTGDDSNRLPREVLLYYLYEKNITQDAADKLYSYIIRFEPEDSEFYRQMEARMRDHAMKSLMDQRINRHLSVIYDRMIYPDMIDEKTADILPDLVRSHRITTLQQSAAFVHVRYPEMEKNFSERFDQGIAYVPVYYKDAEITLHESDGSQIPDAAFTNTALMNRPDLLRRCFALDHLHPMLLLTAAREIAGHGAGTEGEKQVLVNALTELNLTADFRTRLIRTLCHAGGSTGWLANIPLSELNAETGSFAFRSFLDSGRLQEAYLYVRSRGIEDFDLKDLERLADGLLKKQEKPVDSSAETDRFFLCLCKYLFDHEQITPQILEFLTEEYAGTSADMVKILCMADQYAIPVHELPQRCLTVMLFAETRTSIDEVFTIYVKQDEQKELLLRAFFVFRMTDYFEHLDLSVQPSVFEALESYFQVARMLSALPDILLIGLTRFYSEKPHLTPLQTDLCQRLTDQLIGKELIFSYTKALRKKITIPGSVCEKFYVDYMGTSRSDPRMMGKVLPDETEFSPVYMKKVFHNVYVASIVLFMGDRFCYRIYDDVVGRTVASEGVIEVSKMHGKEEDRYLWLNRMTREIRQRDVEGLKNDMIKYAVSTQLNRELFQIEDI